jgi:hypothetical protein
MKNWTPLQLIGTAIGIQISRIIVNKAKNKDEYKR